MGEQCSKKPKKHICAALLAHVDAGKTTLSEGLLYLGGCIGKMGRVDHKDAFFDTNEMERKRGITIFSKMAQITIGEFEVALLDTPGHTDFSAEMERTLSVIDYGILIISGPEGVQGHTKTLWKLLLEYDIPVFIFVNKMDSPAASKDEIMSQMEEKLSDNIVDFSSCDGRDFYEAAAMCREDALEEYLEKGSISDEKIRDMICERKIFPCYFGSALKMEGVEEFFYGLGRYFSESENEPEADRAKKGGIKAARTEKDAGTEEDRMKKTDKKEAKSIVINAEEPFGARVYQIRRDSQGNRLTFMKITEGVLKVKDSVPGKGKVNQLRIYSGEKFQAVPQVERGMVCAAVGLADTKAGEGLGTEEGIEAVPMLSPVLKYQILWPEDVDPVSMVPKLKQLEEESPELHIEWQEEKKETLAMLMGEIQTDILKQRIRDEFGVDAEFGAGQIIYKETIARPVVGVGHFEPLRHYAEVHLLLEPLPRGSGMEFDCDVSEDLLDRNWQRLVLTHLGEKEHKGVLTGAALTDIKITLIAGRAHLKHTEGGDFRQATYRAVRQGLMEAESVLLEPYYDFSLEIPSENLGRAMTDLEQRMGKYEVSQENDKAVITGSAPVSLMRDYPTQVLSYTKGFGKISLVPGDYGPCHNALEVIEASGYNPEEDVLNPSSSVFCAHGSGYLVSWQDAKRAMHIGDAGKKYFASDGSYAGGGYGDLSEISGGEGKGNSAKNGGSDGENEGIWLGTEEVDAILNRAHMANKKPERRNPYRKTKVRAFSSEKSYGNKSYGDNQDGRVSVNFAAKREKYLLVDGYNIIFAWPELAKMAKDNLEGARNRLKDILCNYQGYEKINLILVFDAYRVEGHKTEISDYHNIHIVFTKEAETADQYIEKFAHEHGKKYDVTVATSDGLEQVIITGEGCRLLSAREFLNEVEDVEKKIREIIN